MPDLEISKLPVLNGTALATLDVLPVSDLSASETKKITAKDLLQAGIALIDDHSIPGIKVDPDFLPGSIDTIELADGAVTAIKLADDSSTSVSNALPANGVFIGQLGYERTGGTMSIWTGSSWTPFKASASINSGSGIGTGLIPVTVTQVGTELQVSAAHGATTAPARFLAGPTLAGGAVSQRAIVGADLPIASAAELGAVKVSGGGLTISADGLMAINRAITPSTTFGVVTYDSEGLITAGRPIAPGDLPIAIPGAIGAVMPGTGLVVTGAGALNHANIVTPSSGLKVSYDESGHVTGTLPVTAADIPVLPASQITSGQFDPARIADRSITAQKLADYATSYIQDVQPANTGNTIGQLWLNPLAQQIRMWDGNVWVPIGIGALNEQNLRFCGLFDATNGKITAITRLGRDAGYAVGDTVSLATDQLTGVYFVCDTPGSATGVTPGIAYTAGDWVLCLGLAQGWSRIDVTDALGGGGGARRLDDLVDVDAPTPAANQILQFDGALWRAATSPYLPIDFRTLAVLP